MSWRSCLTNPLWRVPLLAGLILIIGLNAATWSKQRLERQIGPLIHNTTLPPATAQCTSCHREISEHYLETGHAKSLWRGDDPQVLSRFTNLEYEWSPEGPRYRYVVEEGKLWLTQEGSPLRLRTDWVMGSGGHSQGAVQLFTTPTGETEMLEHMLAWYPSVGLAPALGNDEKKIVPNGLSALAVRQEHANAKDCLGCHSTHVTIDDSGKIDATQVVGKVGCVRCHADAGIHAAQNGATTAFRERWSQLSPQNVIERCGECHRRAYEFDPRDIHPQQRNIVRFAPVGLSQSRCFQGQHVGTDSQPAVRLDCLTCHDVHRPLIKDHSFYQKICHSCHTDQGAIASTCPSQPSSSDCVSCHMPAVQTDPNLRFTDHWIRIRKE